MKTLPVYNLEFPKNIHQINIGGYLFKRVPEYGERFKKLQHVFDKSGGEFTQEINGGSHQITATVVIPEIEDSPSLQWGGEHQSTKLQDVIFLLTLFSGRNVIVLIGDSVGFPFSFDARCHQYGWDFRSFMHHKIRRRNKTTNELTTDDQMNGKKVSEWEQIDLGFEETVNKVLMLVSSREWRGNFDQGYFLFLFRQVVSGLYLETRFLLSWTIWENLFASHNKKYLDKKAIQSTGGVNKIAFIYQKYFSDYSMSPEQIKGFCDARNRLAHYGVKPDAVDYKELRLFSELTEEIVAKVLGLTERNNYLD